MIIEIEGIHRVTEGFSAKSREKELVGEKTPIRGTLGIKRQNGHHSGCLTPGVQHPGRLAKRAVKKGFLASNASQGTWLGVKRPIWPTFGP